MKLKGLIVLVLLLGLVAFTTYLSLNSDFIGTDDQATDMIISLDAGYEPWYEAFFEPSESLEVILFVAQGLLGSVAVVYFASLYKKKASRA